MSKEQTMESLRATGSSDFVTMTIAGQLFKPKGILPLPIEDVVTLPDGDRTLLHDDRPAEWKPGDRCALLLHGLGGSHLSPHMVRIASKLNSQGIRAFRLDLRGHGHSDRPQDAERYSIEIFADGEAYVVDNFQKATRASDGHVLWQSAEPDKGHAEEFSLLGDAIANGGVAPISFEEIVETTAVSLHVEDLLHGREEGSA